MSAANPSAEIVARAAAASGLTSISMRPGATESTALLSSVFAHAAPRAAPSATAVVIRR